ncbi:polyprenyl synthetase family protein [Eikenella sp. Marseille-P7795]|uniref:polyprenyl synthetase family protein n=1 Tax=Eikenella sp. Marseille-P7795 TaxID=2866577 RepID=UPI001CE3E196|nr:farnesyl diphosphate synthase [Eikenella sp. Marseille-P7795]
MSELKQWQQRARAQTELVLERVLPAASSLPEGLHEAMRYAVLGGGKRLRPLLVLAAAELGESDQAAAEAALAAVELVHAYSLVHDDMPAMDNDSLRRGKPTCHVQYGEAAALLVGDALQTLAFDVLSRPGALPAARQLEMVHTLARASGSLGMAGGQAIDLQSVGRQIGQAELETMHRLKTGALIRAAVALGGLSCPDLDEDALAKLDSYAAKLGLAFQVIDDVLDCEADTATLGKTAGKDQEADKPTYVRLMGLAAARAYAERLVAEAQQALAGFGERAERLRQLAAYVTARGN